MFDAISFHSARTCVLTIALTCSFAALAQEVAVVQQTTKHRVTQVVVGGERGGAYLMKTLQPLISDTLVVTSDMACSAEPFSLASDVFAPVTSLAQIGSASADCQLDTQQLKVLPGVKAFHTYFLNYVYEVLYEHKGHWMMVELTELPPNGQLVLTDAVKSASRTAFNVASN